MVYIEGVSHWGLISAAIWHRFLILSKPIFRDFLVIYANSVVLAKVSPVSEPSFERHGACHVSQSSSMDISKWDFWLCQSMIFWVLLRDYLCDFYNFSGWHMRFLHIHHQWVWVQGVCLLAALKLQQIFLQFRQIGNLVLNCLYAEHGDVIYPNKFLDSFHKISIQHKVLWNKARKLARRFRKYAKW